MLAAPLVLIWLCGTATTELVMRARGSSGTLASRTGLSTRLVVWQSAASQRAETRVADQTAAPILFVTLVLVAVFRRVVGQAGARQAILCSSVEGDARPSKWSPGAAGGALAVVVAIGLALVIEMLPAMSHAPASLNRAFPRTAAGGSSILSTRWQLARQDDNPADPAWTLVLASAELLSGSTELATWRWRSSTITTGRD